MALSAHQHGLLAGKEHSTDQIQCEAKPDSVSHVLPCKLIDCSRGRSILSDSWVRLTSIYDVPSSSPLAQPFLPISHQPKQNQAKGGTAKLRVNPTQQSDQMWRPVINFLFLGIPQKTWRKAIPNLPQMPTLTWRTQTSSRWSQSLTTRSTCASQASSSVTWRASSGFSTVGLATMRVYFPGE